ncbi:ABC transporter substrate-binding protein [Kineosporia succinea]|uniref:Peptide/nickel transport system substrate-binding protein n=1 Tax=Kineosporia succinea TaxID=84632 RepID=A0ABT9PAP5_9ACTN|nr:ABC transporter substrate-binding protein [Kineosporia succinea]MDP9829115.1 peptide/nickel transport system substrate-binding protein [Kineosporia succinea]
MNPSRRTLLSGLLGLPVLGATLAACGGGSGSGAAAGAATLKWASSYFPTHWDPVVGGSGAQFRHLSLVYASITRVNEKGEAQPDLAESWDYNDQGDQVTFHIRSGLTFSDGTPVDADAVKQAVDRARTQENSALFGDLTSIDKVTTEGDLDVVVHLTQVDYQIPLLFGERVLQVASPKAAADAAALDQQPVGHGPFVATQIIPGTKAVLEKNPDYWDAANIHIDKVELVAAPDASTVVSGLQTGVYNFADLAASQAKAAESAGLDVFVQPGYNASNLSLNVNRKPFDDPKVVEAVRHGLNRQEFVDKLTFGYGTPATQPFPEEYIAYDPQSADLWPYDVAKAKAALAQSRYSGDDLKVELVIPDEDPSAEIVQAQLAAIGITVTITIDKNWATPFFAKDLVASLYGTTGRDSPLQTLTAHFGPNGPLNLSTPYEPDGFEDAVAKVRQTPLEDAAYAENLQAATRAGLVSEALVFTYSQPSVYVKDPSISDIPANPGHVNWTGVKIT